MMHGTFPRKLEDAVLDSMKDNRNYSMRILDTPESFRAFAAVALRLLLATTYRTYGSLDPERAATTARNPIAIS